MARDQNGVTLSGWRQLGTSIVTNSGDLPHLETHRTQLGEILGRAENLSSQQATLTASKQDVSKQLQDVMDEGRKLATFLRAGVKQHYGNRAEKLVEFGLRPFRSRRRLTDAQPPTTEKPTPPPTTGVSAPGNPVR
ncbi:MAG: hypothetical protein QOF89_3052 [Acidobacteriota bacterium]|jgi:hypothetical protein|nr:hypothetical protein [Acidobacteriota bacterium]